PPSFTESLHVDEVLGSVADRGCQCLLRRHVAVDAAPTAATDPRCGRVLRRPRADVGGVPGRGRGVDAGAADSERIQHDVPLRVLGRPRRDRHAVPGRRQHDCALGAVRHPGRAPDGRRYDSASAEAFAPAVANVSLDGLGAESAASGTRLLTERDELTVSLMIGPTTTVTRPYVALPESQLLAGDLQILAASTTAATTRSATPYFRAPTGRTLTLGAPLIPPTFST